VSALPDSAYPVCVGCGGPIYEPDSRLVLHEVSGWTRLREQGGANHVIARRETGRLACADCALTLQRTGSFEQGRLV
jgi:hypothetical protein